MKKRLTIVLSVVLVVALSCVLLIGCTPSNPADFMTKWAENKNISVTMSVTMDKVIKETQKDVFEEVAGRTIIETTYIQNKDIIMSKVVKFTNIKDKDGKFAPTDTITPISAVIFELKDGKYNIYNYERVWEKESETSEKIVNKGKWTASQEEKAKVEAENLNYTSLKAMLDEITANAKEFATAFEQEYTKDKGGVYTQKEKEEDGSYTTCKVESGKLVIRAFNSENKEVLKASYNLSDKAIIASEAKDALKKFLNPNSK